MNDAASQVQAGPPPAAPVPPPAAPVAVPAAVPKPRLWPAVVIVALEWAAILAPRNLDLSMFVQFMCVFLAPLVATVALAVWWLFFSRLRWRDRWLGFGVCAALGVAALLLVSYPAVVLGMYALPWVTTVWAGWLFATPFLPWPTRLTVLLAAFVPTWGVFPLLRFKGVDDAMHGSFVWRWTPKAEDLNMAERAARGEPKQAAAAVVTLRPGDWPGFRGPQRDGRLAGARISTDWGRPPREVWRHRVGPGWGSFAVVGDRLYTQEQNGRDEMVVCYNADNGDEIWEHKDDIRFEEVVADAGPRATPTFAGGRIYALGARGLLNCLDAATGAPVWQHDIVADSGAKVPQWGFSSSPLVENGVVIVFAGGPNGKGVLAYDAVSGAPAWSAGDGGLSYSSPQPARLDDVDQVLMMTDAGVTALDPAHGDVLWRHDWPLQGMFRILQPAVVDGSDVLVGCQPGTRRLHVSHDGGAWKAEEVWTSKALNPFFKDQVVYQGYIYGFDGNNLACVSLEDATTAKWRKRYEHAGQILLLADQGLLLILWEYEGVSLVQASPDGFKELGRFQPPLEDKTWNHPVVAHGKLFVRNAEWAACYQLTEEGGASEGK